MAKVARSKWCQAIAPVLFGVLDPRGMAMSSAVGMVSVRSWWASAEVRQIVASGRRVAASI
ncbi:hypothetical protein B1790_31695 [Mycobacterium sp. AT1]|nr:hypothetical protein B1790_31695 [Mycobacterium sp. AT1]